MKHITFYKKVKWFRTGSKASSGSQNRSLRRCRTGNWVVWHIIDNQLKVFWLITSLWASKHGGVANSVIGTGVPPTEKTRPINWSAVRLVYLLVRTVWNLSFDQSGTSISVSVVCNCIIKFLRRLNFSYMVGFQTQEVCSLFNGSTLRKS